MFSFLALITILLLAHRIVNAQVTSAFTDPVTGISFQRFFGAKTSFAFGIALPVNPTTDFIGQITCPIANGNGWGGITLADDMVYFPFSLLPSLL